MDPRTGHSERFEHWTTAVEQSQIVAHNLLATDKSEFTSLQAVPYVWSDQFDRRLQLLGRVADSDDEVVLLDYRAERRAISLYSRNGLLAGLAALGMPKVLPTARRLIDTLASTQDVVDAIGMRVS